MIARPRPAHLVLVASTAVSAALVLTGLDAAFRPWLALVVIASAVGTLRRPDSWAPTLLIATLALARLAAGSDLPSSVVLAFSILAVHWSAARAAWPVPRSSPLIRREAGSWVGPALAVLVVAGLVGLLPGLTI